ncbi:hypothetical protein OAJ57_01450 [Alphaproteobacteria bacterium]|nr:hypothetical protein [Alphaproteobacteria bacterium]
MATAGLITALYFVVAACQPVPKPFAHPEKTVNPIVTPSSDFGGVTILPILGLSRDRARSLSTAMAISLLSHGIIAGPDRSNHKSKFLQGTTTLEPAGGDRTKITVIWDLFDTSGKLLGWRKAVRYSSQSDWEKDEPKTFQRLAGDAAAGLAKLIAGPSGKAAPNPRITLHVWPMEGEPTEDNGPLRRAMKIALKKRNFRIADALENAGLVIAGAIELGPENINPTTIQITWSVLDTTGRELGTLTQRNAIPSQELRNLWKALATVIAENAAGGISDLVVRLPGNSLRPNQKPTK